MKKKILFITILSRKAGIGHFQRCINISNNLKKNYCNVMLLALTDQFSSVLHTNKEIIYIKNKNDINKKNILDFIKKSDVFICDSSNKYFIKKVKYFISIINQNLQKKIKKIIYPSNLSNDKLLTDNSKFFNILVWPYFLKKKY